MREIQKRKLRKHTWRGTYVHRKRACWTC